MNVIYLAALSGEVKFEQHRNNRAYKDRPGLITVLQFETPPEAAGAKPDIVI
jgi:hypothetical protein